MFCFLHKILAYMARYHFYFYICYLDIYIYIDIDRYIYLYILYIHLHLHLGHLAGFYPKPRFVVHLYIHIYRYISSISSNIDVDETALLLNGCAVENV